MLTAAWKRPEICRVAQLSTPLALCSKRRTARATNVHVVADACTGGGMHVRLMLALDGRSVGDAALTRLRVG